MGVWIKSAIGLGGVYFAMFGQALHAPDVQSAATACLRAVEAGDTLQGKFAAASCAQSATTHAQRLTAALATPAAPVNPPPPRASAPAAPPKPGTLTEADLSAPWYGPTRSTRKTSRRS